MISFFACLALLIVGFTVYSKIAEKVFGPDDRKTPAITMEDGSDYVPTVSYTHLRPRPE